MPLPDVRATVRPLADEEQSKGSKALMSPLSARDDSDPSCDELDLHSDVSGDLPLAANASSEDAADIVTTSAATWCVHLSLAADADPLVSFFSQLVASHTLVAAEDDEAPGSENYHKSARSTDAACVKEAVGGWPEADADDGYRGAQERQGDNAEWGWGCNEPSPTAGMDLELKKYLEGSLKRENASHILGSIRSVIRANSTMFGLTNSAAQSASDMLPKSPLVAGSPSADEAAGAEQEAVAASPEAAAGRSEEEFDQGLTADDLLPPPIPVNLEFCRAHPRVAVNWLTHAQAEAAVRRDEGPSVRNAAGGFRPAELERLDPDTQAQLACLVPPEWLDMSDASMQRGHFPPRGSPVRDALREATVRLLGSLNAHEEEALSWLLQSWYYSGFFTGLRGRSRDTLN
ncbi:hypothetical protein Efla_005000 [Eimeria flavescens]